jgi:hypothetical protein
MGNRDGHRKSREVSRQKRIPRLGHYLIFTDTNETEKNYLNGLKKCLPEDTRDSLLIMKIEREKTNDLVHKCCTLLAMEPQYCEPWIVLDRDQVTNFDNIIDEAQKEGINVGWSNPCIEIWFSAYFNKMDYCIDSKTCCSRFGDVYKLKTKMEYDKSFDKIYDKLVKYGNEEGAFLIAERKRRTYSTGNVSKPSDMCPGTTLDLLVKEISGKIKSYKEC